MDLLDGLLAGETRISHQSQNQNQDTTTSCDSISTPPDQDRSSFSAAHILSEPMSPCHICRVARPYIVYSRRRGLFVSLVLDAQQFQEKQGVGQNRQLGGYDSR